jgi:site-specific recombinase XerD
LESDIGIGLRQGDALSTILFNILLEKVIRNIEINTNGTILTEQDSIQHMQMISLIFGLSVRVTEVVVIQLKEIALRTGLVINDKKTKYMRINRCCKCTARLDNRWTGT